MSDIQYSHMLGQPLGSILPEFSDDHENFFEDIGISDMQEETCISICALKALTSAGQKSYERIWNAEIHDIYHTKKLDEGWEFDWLVIKVKGVTAEELNELDHHYDSFMEAEEMMWQC